MQCYLNLVNLLTQQKNQEKIFFVLQHPIRRWIIELLNTNNLLSSSDLAKLLHIDLSRCCYHLENLNGLVNQDSKSRYFLNKEGKRAYLLLKKSKESLIVLRTQSNNFCCKNRSVLNLIFILKRIKLTRKYYNMLNTLPCQGMQPLSQIQINPMIMFKGLCSIIIIRPINQNNLCLRVEIAGIFNVGPKIRL